MSCHDAPTRGTCSRVRWSSAGPTLTRCLQGQAHRGDLALAAGFQIGRVSMLLVGPGGCGKEVAAIVQLEGGSTSRKRRMLTGQYSHCAYTGPNDWRGGGGTEIYSCVSQPCLAEACPAAGAVKSLTAPQLATPYLWLRFGASAPAPPFSHLAAMTPVSVPTQNIQPSPNHTNVSNLHFGQPRLALGLLVGGPKGAWLCTAMAMFHNIDKLRCGPVAWYRVQLVMPLKPCSDRALHCTLTQKRSCGELLHALCLGISPFVPDFLLFAPSPISKNHLQPWSLNIVLDRKRNHAR